ncbi:hypothetical protein Tco_0721701 [Tanacetum coccineum]
MTPATSSSGLVSNPIPQQLCNSPQRDDWDILFQPMFDEYFNPPIIVVSPVPADNAPRAVDLANSPVSTSIDQDAPSTKPKNFKQAMTEPSWINAMTKKEIMIFERQANGIDFEESFAPVARIERIEAIRIFVAIAWPTQEYDDFFQYGRQTVSYMASPKKVDPTLFTRKAGNDLLLMSFFLGLQISQSPRGIFLNRSKYASEIIKKYGLLTSDSVDTPMVEKNKLDEDLQGTPVDATLYRGMIGSLMYLTSSRPNLIYAVCLCARYQAKCNTPPRRKHEA